MSEIFSNRSARKSRFGSVSRRMKAFQQEERGSITIESLIILPLLFSALMALFTYYDAYRKQSLSLRANYAISDFLSRVYKYDNTTVTGLDNLFSYLSKTSEKSWIRITVVKCDVVDTQCNNPLDRKLKYMSTDSAASPGEGSAKYTDEAQMINALGAKIPNMYEGEYLFVLETSASYRPIFPGSWTGIYSTDFKQSVVTKSREFQFLCFEGEGKTCVDPNVTFAGSTSG
ncbi:hypothetical protein [Aliiroseovarius sp. F20344]|uniref:TadE/TadG family type IV pilus assembly protein n=1 Tax=Aliiroseovarius sp. F20344 TaxID=2926414 RepID=UPI001FF18FC4|nr:hypothetical protein [Aliiroseovarius sp. F20344]MCK0143457.1 hypothetical protein [Aliiroseovarius sp. F20344]